MYCRECKKEKDKSNFYQGFDECKTCIGDYLNKFSNGKAFDEVKNLLHNNNYIINEELLHDIFFSEEDKYRGNNSLSKISVYLKSINCLPQYKDYKYRVIDKEKSDLDFINEDIEKVKEHIQFTLKDHDVNAHNKWMNCLRDAIELRERLLGGSKYTINLGTINVNSNNAEELMNEIIKLTEKKMNTISY